MSLDTPETASGELDASQAASLIANILEPAAAPENKKPEDAQPSAKADPDTPQANPDDATGKSDDTPPVDGDSPNPDETITIEVDGKAVEIKKSELPDLYKGQLRQADYTKKTMEVAEQRKAAEAEATKAREERQQYAQGLSQAQALLQAQLQEQGQIDWHRLRETDRDEFLKQWHLYSERQASLQAVVGEQQRLNARTQAEQAEQMKAYVRTQHEELVAKLPEWKDESKAKADKAAIKDYLTKEGFDAQALNNISDHRAVLLARKAMLYDQLMSKASFEAKRVPTLPQKVERPGTGAKVSPLDGRTSAMRQLSKTGKFDDGVAAIARLL